MHVIECDTRYLNASFVKGKSVRALCSLFTEIWPTVYRGYPDILKVDRETPCIAKDFTAATEDSGVVIQAPDSDAHNDIYAGERHYHAIRHVFTSVLKVIPSIPGPAALIIKVKALDEAMGSRRIVTSLLVFGQLPRFAGRQYTCTQKYRMVSMATVREETDNIMYESCINHALWSRVSPATRFHLKPGYSVRVYLEDLRR